MRSWRSSGTKYGLGKTVNRMNRTRALLASQRLRLSQSLLLFAILSQVLNILYVVVILQIALGIYSLWDGFKWLRMVRLRLSSHAGFYTPVVALICPCKG